jgi:cell division protein FtsB
LLALVALYLLAGIVGRAINIVEIKRQQVAAQEKNQYLQREIERLQKEVLYMQSDSYIEQAARTVLLWGRPGEKLIISSAATTAPMPTAVPTRRP